MDLQQSEPSKPGRRFSSEYQPRHNGRVATEWLRKKLDRPIGAVEWAERFKKVAGENDSIRGALVDRMIEIAFTDEVIVIGADGEGEPIKRISSRESLEAIKALWLYDIGKPREVEGPKIQLPDGLIRDGMSLVDIAAAVYRWRLTSGQMGETEFAEMVKLMLSVDQAKLQLLLRLLGKDSGSLSPDEVLAKLNDHHEPAAQISDSSPVDTGDSGGTNASQHGPAGSGESAAENPVPPGEPGEGSEQG